MRLYESSDSLSLLLLSLLLLSVLLFWMLLLVVVGVEFLLFVFTVEIIEF